MRRLEGDKLLQLSPQGQRLVRKAHRIRDQNPFANGFSTHRVWLRRGGPSHPNVRGHDHEVEVTQLGNAAARETFVTAAPHAAIWTRLFCGMIAEGCDLRWSGNGPGIGRDARIAYSGLMGRYMARAYLTTQEGIRHLVPLDVAADRLRQVDYRIEKASPGYLADWIGLDSVGLVIAEAKGSFDPGVRNWRGPTDTPRTLCTAMKQVRRTLVVAPNGRRVPARRWAVVSRWGTEENGKDPTILAWRDDDRGRPERSQAGFLAWNDLVVLRQIFADADFEVVATGLGHGRNREKLAADESAQNISADRTLVIDDFSLGPGLVAAVGPFGSLPLRGTEDLRAVDRIRERSPGIAFVSLSRDYFAGRTHDQFPSSYAEEPRFGDAGIRCNRVSNQAGLTVAWPRRFERVVLDGD